MKYLIDRSKEDIEVDGNITFENAKILRNVGASMFVARTSSAFKGEREENDSNILRLGENIS